MGEITPTISSVELFSDVDGEEMAAVGVTLTGTAALTWEYGNIDLAAQDKLGDLQRGMMELELEGVYLGQGTTMPMPTALAASKVERFYVFNAKAPTSDPGSLGLFHRNCIKSVEHTLDLDGVAATGGVLHAHENNFPDEEDKEAVVTQLRSNRFNKANGDLGIARYGSLAAFIHYALFIFRVIPMETILVDGREVLVASS